MTTEKITNNLYPREFVKVFVKNEKGEILLVKEENAASRTWDFPGGKVELSDYEKTEDKTLSLRDQKLKTYKFAAVEELKEECNLKVKSENLSEIFRVGHIFNGKCWNGIYLLLLINSNSEIKNNESHNISQVKFVPEKEALVMLLDSYPDMKKKLLKDVFRFANFSK